LAILDFIEGQGLGKDGKIMRLSRHFTEKLRDLARRRPDLASGPFGLGGMIAFTPLGGDPERVARYLKNLFEAGVIGFIAETHPADLYENLEEILAGQIRIEERLMVQADIVREERCVHSGFGLNDVSLKSKMTHILNMKTRIGGAYFATYPADGVVVATPTGSTGYALSAGGPLIAPSVEAFVIAPICPHTLSARPIVIPSNETIEIEVETDGHEVIFAIDGVEPVALQTGDRVVVQKAPHRTRLIIVDHTTFYAKVRNRYLYGERLNN